MSAILEPGLAALAARRAAGAGVLAWSIVLASISIVTRGSPPRAWIGDVAADAASQAGLARQNMWTAFFLGLVPLLVARAASRSAPWRRDDSNWLASRARGNAAIVTSTWLGAFAASALFALAFAFAAETVHTSDSTLRYAGSLRGPDARWVESNAPIAWSTALGDLPIERGVSARLELGLGPGSGARFPVTLRARRASDPAGIFTAESSASIESRGAIEIELPRGSGDASFELSIPAGDARAYVLGTGLGCWTRASAHAASSTMYAHTLLALAAWLAIALGFSAWTSTATAVLGALALWTLLWWTQGAPVADAISAWIPGAHLHEALEIVGRGRAPAGIDARTVTGTCVLVLAGLAIGVAGLRSWRAAR